MEKVENKIDEMRIENRVQVTKVYVGSGDDYIAISGNDISLIDRFIGAGDALEKLAEEMQERSANLPEGDYKAEIEERKHFSERATEIMDGVFGEGATRKYFGDIYAELPNFQPDLECFMDFWDALIPVIEKMSEHKVKLESLASKKRMAKYQPQDHKKPAKK